MIRNHNMKTCKLISRLFNNHLNSALTVSISLKGKRVSKYVDESEDDDFMVKLAHKASRKRDVKRRGKNARAKAVPLSRARPSGLPRPPVRRAPTKSLLDTVSLFELIMPWKSDLPKLVFP